MEQITANTIEVWIPIAVSFLALIFSICTWFSSISGQRKEATIKAYRELQPNLFYLYEYKSKEIETFVTDVDSDEYKALSANLAQIEIFAKGIESKVYDFDTFYVIAHGYLDGALRERIEYILQLKNAGKNEPAYYLEIYALLKRMDKETKKRKEKQRNKAKTL